MVAVLTTGPAVEPITLTEANEHLKTSGENDLVNALIMTARTMVERYLNRSLILQTWTAYTDEWCREFELPYPPLLGVTSVKYYDTGGTLQTLSTANYWVDNKEQPGEIELAYDYSPPELQLGRPNSIEIIYTAGYLATGTSDEKQHAVPDPIKHAIKVLLTDLYEHRGQYVIGSGANKIPGFVIDLIHTYKMYN